MRQFQKCAISGQPTAQMRTEYQRVKILFRLF